MVNCSVKDQLATGPQHIISMTKIFGNGVLAGWLILFATGIMQAQEKQSYEKKSKKEYPSSKLFVEDEIGPLLSKAESMMKKDPEGSIGIVEKALTESIKKGDKYYEAQSYRVLGAINLNSNLNELALKNTLKAFQLLQERKDESSLSLVRIQLADCYDRTGNTEEALKLYNDQLERYGRYISEQETMNIRYRIAEIYTKQGKTKQAELSYQEILKLEQNRQNKEGIIEANKKIGELYEQQQQNVQALQYYNRAQDVAANTNDMKSYNRVNENISSVLKKEKKYEDEIQVRKRGLELTKGKNDPESESQENLAIATAYLDSRKPEEALPYLKRSLELTSKSEKLEQKAEVFRQLSNAYSQKNQYTKAISNYQKYVALKDSIIKQREEELELAIRSNLSLTEKQKQIDLLEKDIELNKQKIAALTSAERAREARLSRLHVIIYSLILGIIVIVIASYLVYKNARKRRIANQLLALKSLRSQMNPHFIFNALNSVNSFISKNDEKSANKYLSDFSRLMRMVMENSQQDFVPLAAEINILELYIGLEHFRFREKFEYTFNVDEKIDKDAFEVPPMLIQPYIENAVWHGLRYKETKGILAISFHLTEDQQIKVVIEDDGIGRKRSAELKTINQKTGTSTGIKNTVNRIAIINEIYRKNIVIEIEDISSERADSGTRVTIKLPGKITNPVL
jgi:two-component system, LytTR family, sensor kinase